VFLDELGELSLAAQAKLLRVLEAREVTPVGSSERIPVDVRIVAATHRDLHERVRAGAFREDLLMRLEAVSVHLPSLCDRRGDVWPLFRAFAETALRGPLPRVTAAFIEAVMLHDWPGNVRQLKLTAERLAVLHAGAETWHHRHLALARPETTTAVTPTVEVRGPASNRRGKKRIERAELVQALEASGGVVADAARSLGVARQTVYSLVREHGLDLVGVRPAPPRSSRQR
jgi:DNA-binding NtrC family response regulator